MSVKELLEPPVNYKRIDELQTPFLRARQEWDGRMGSALAQARNWRVACILSLFICGVSVVLAGVLLRSPRMIPVVVTVEKVSGKTRVLGDITARDYVPGEVEIKYFLSKLIQKVRAVPKDAVVVRKNWAEAYKFLRSAAGAKLNELTNSDKESALHQIGEQMVTAELVSVLRVGESSSYQARWSEVIFDKNGQRLNAYTMTGIFTVEVERPEREDVLLINPLGIYVTDFQWNKEL